MFAHARTYSSPPRLRYWFSMSAMLHSLSYWAILIPSAIVGPGFLYLGVFSEVSLTSLRSLYFWLYWRCAISLVVIVVCVHHSVRKLQPCRGFAPHGKKIYRFYRAIFVLFFCILVLSSSWGFVSNTVWYRSLRQSCQGRVDIVAHLWWIYTLVTYVS